MTPLETIAAWASRITAAEIPGAQHALARLRLLDTLGLIAAAADHPAGRSLAAWSAAETSAGATVLISGRQAAPATAALVHGSLAHARDFDDTFPDTVVHPGSTVIAATLAAGERADAGFDDLTSAIVVGYEIAARLGAVAGRGFHARGFHATGIVGPIAAAAAAGRMLRLDPSAMADALGLATSMSGGLLAFLGDGGWSKWLHTGWSAHGGLIAAEIAGQAFRGPRHALDHRYGLYGAFLGEPEASLDVLTEGLGHTWRGAGARPKQYPCAHVIEPYVDAALALRAEGRVSAETVQSLECILAPWALPIVGEPRDTKVAPRNDLEAIASLPFMLAAALADGRVDLGDAAARNDCPPGTARSRAADHVRRRRRAGHRLRRPHGDRAAQRRASLPPGRAGGAERRAARCQVPRQHGTLAGTRHTTLEGAVLHEKPPVRALVQLAVDGLAKRQNTRP